MDYAELTIEQRRQLVDAQQVFGVWHPPAMELSRLGSLYWNTSHGRRYLYEKRHGVRKSLGRESPATVKQKSEHQTRAMTLRATTRQLKARMDRMAPVNRAIGIARMPTIAARIVRALDSEQLLGSHIIIAGTNALYAYETAAGVLIGGEHVATGDADLLWDTRQSLLLTVTGVRRQGLLSVLKSVDTSFTTAYGHNPTNRDGYVVDLITAETEDFLEMRPKADISAQEITGAQWLLSAPQFTQIVVGADGLPLRMIVPEPRTYALHKLWVSRRNDRTAIKRPRDERHARLVADLAQKYLGLSFDASDMPWLPEELAPLAKVLAPAKTRKRKQPN